MTGNAPARRRCGEGFTIVELLIALLLSTMLLGLAFSGLRTYLATSARVDDALHRHTEDRAVLAFVRRQLLETVPLVVNAKASRVLLFVGEQDSLHFVGKLPSHRAAGGIFYNTFAVEDEKAGRALEFSYARLPGGHDWEMADLFDREPEYTRRLVGELEAMTFEYYGRNPDDPEPQWQPNWTASLWLPDLVRVTLDSAHGRSAQVTVNLRARYAPRRLALQVQADDGADEQERTGAEAPVDPEQRGMAR